MPLESNVAPHAPPEHKGIFWLASYPKSGNTWFRIFLANLLNTTDTPIDLNSLQTGAIASGRCWVDTPLGFDSADLAADELDNLRPAVYQWHAEQAEGPQYHKIHDAYTYLPDQRPLIPLKGCLGAIYFIRNPLDVAISFANHSQCSIDESINNMGNPNFAFCKGKYRQHNQLRQWLLSWSMHVESWVDAKNLNILPLRYEDMKRNPLETFTKAAQFLQLDASEASIIKAIDNAHIEKLQAMEEQFGFCEKPAKVARFFRKGLVNDWKNTLTTEQIQRIIHSHGKTMQAYGYLDEHHQPID